MAWTDEGPAVTREQRGTPIDPLGGTSRSTVPVSSFGGLLSAVRMYGIDAGDLANGATPASDFLPGNPGCSSTQLGPGETIIASITGYSSDYAHLLWLDQDRSTGTFSIVADGSNSYDLAGTTCLPQFKSARGWTFWTYESYTSAGLTEQSATEFLVYYKDPCVVRVPSELGGGWLMVVSRVRVRREDAADWYVANRGLPPDEQFDSDDEFTDALRNLTGRGQCFTDIVAFHSRNATFGDGQVRGPFLLVDGAQALDDTYFRLWLGVPGATFFGDEGGERRLYVYYAVEYSASDADDVPYLDQRDGYKTAVDSWTDSRYGFSFGPGIAVSCFEGQEVRQQLAASPPPEASWEPGDAWSALFRSPVRLWVAEPEAGHGVSLFTEKYGLTKTVDPAPVTCDCSNCDECDDCDEGSIALFFAATLANDNALAILANVTPKTGHGVWRSASVPDSTLLYGGRTRFGADFVVAPLQSSIVSVQTGPGGLGINTRMEVWRSDDQVAQSSEHHLYLDPDPWWDADGAAFRVFFGDPNGTPTNYYRHRLDSDQRTCVSWEHAWDGLDIPEFDPPTIPKLPPVVIIDREDPIPDPRNDPPDGEPDLP